MFRRLYEHLNTLYQQLNGVTRDLDGVSRDLDGVSHKLDLIERDLLLRDPGSAKAAEAYDGLRRQVVAAFSERQAHLAQLAQLDVAVRRGESGESLALLLQDLMRQAGLLRINDGANASYYEVVQGKGDHLVVLEPAYVDDSTKRVVRQGRARAESSTTAEESLVETDEISGAVSR